MKTRKILGNRLAAIVTLCGLLGHLPLAAADPPEILTPSKDASIYQYDSGMYVYDNSDTYPKADGTTHLHVGDTNNNNGVQRGLLQFDFGSIPDNAIVTDARLSITVADVPNRVLQRDIHFWMVPIEGLSASWSEGPAGDKYAAVPDDTTWFHTEYDPAQHGELGNDTDNPFRDFNAAGPGYWPAPGYLGHDDLLDTAPGAGVGGPFDDARALVFGVGSGIGDVLDWSNPGMIDDVQAWVDGSKDNFGWILIGEEWITDADRSGSKPASSKIDFFSRESAGPYNTPPTLSVSYTVVPEPGSVSLLLCALVAAICWRRVKSR
ncbi:MAG TPA: hypothetical protein VE890_16955 [Thermoguttaceae bacterium]|nr:hypothetical protein [Thermoguttaceae bacterium]